MKSATDDMERHADSVYSNFDHELVSAVADKLRENEGKLWAAHPAWDHHGRVWFANGMFHEEVRVYGTIRSVVTSADIMDVIREVNDQYGHG